MPAPGLNGHGYQGAHVVPDAAKAAMLARIEGALQAMAEALRDSGFTIYEAGEVNLQTRFAITGLIKDRGRRQ